MRGIAVPGAPSSAATALGLRHDCVGPNRRPAGVCVLLGSCVVMRAWVDLLMDVLMDALMGIAMGWGC